VRRSRCIGVGVGIGIDSPDAIVSGLLSACVPTRGCRTHRPPRRNVCDESSPQYSHTCKRRMCAAPNVVRPIPAPTPNHATSMPVRLMKDPTLIPEGPAKTSPGYDTPSPYTSANEFDISVEHSPCSQWNFFCPFSYHIRVMMEGYLCLDSQQGERRQCLPLTKIVRQLEISQEVYLCRAECSTYWVWCLSWP
jgi:hypothetical protein